MAPMKQTSSSLYVHDPHCCDRRVGAELRWAAESEVCLALAHQYTVDLVLLSSGRCKVAMDSLVMELSKQLSQPQDETLGYLRRLFIKIQGLSMDNGYPLDL